MAFQFQCPQGHLLSGDESQAGQQCHCPTCGMLFIIPQPIVAPAAASAGAYDHANRWGAIAGESGAAAPAEVPAFVPGGSSSPAATLAATAPAEPELLHIPCPNGHELETPVDMLEQEVLCPQCNAQFRLRRKNSVEYKKKKELEEHVRLEKIGSLWLTWAIVAVVVVVLGLIGLIVASNMNQDMPAPKSKMKAQAAIEAFNRPLAGEGPRRPTLISLL
jgi:hypothetical protein